MVPAILSMPCCSMKVKRTDDGRNAEQIKHSSPEYGEFVPFHFDIGQRSKVTCCSALCQNLINLALGLLLPK